MLKNHMVFDWNCLKSLKSEDIQMSIDFFGFHKMMDFVALLSIF